MRKAIRFVALIIVLAVIIPCFVACVIYVNQDTSKSVESDTKKISEQTRPVDTRPWYIIRDGHLAEAQIRPTVDKIKTTKIDNIWIMSDVYFTLTIQNVSSEAVDWSNGLVFVVFDNVTGRKLASHCLFKKDIAHKPDNGTVINGGEYQTIQFYVPLGMTQADYWEYYCPRWNTEKWNREITCYVTLRAPNDFNNPYLQRVVDDGHYLALDEYNDLRRRTKRLCEEKGFDIAFYSTNLPMGTDNDAANVANSYYDNNGYGIGEKRSGLMLVMFKDGIYISTTGECVYMFDNNKINTMLDAWINERRENNNSYYAGCVAFLDTLEKLTNN